MAKSLLADEFLVDEFLGTTSGASTLARLLAQSTSTIKLKRQARAHILLCGVSATWLICLVLTDSTTQSIAWSVVLMLLLLYSLSRLLGLIEELKYRLSSDATPSDLSETNITELAALTISVSSAVLLAAIVLLQLDFTRLHKPVVNRQVVDIELVSPKDAVDHHDLLPATSVETAIKKRSADQITAPSENLAGAPVRPTPIIRAEEPLKEPVKEPVNQPSKTPVKEPVKKPGDEPAKSPIREPEKQPTRPLSQMEKMAMMGMTETTEIPGRKIPLTFKAPSNWKTVVVAQDRDKSVDFATYSASAALEHPTVKSADYRNQGQAYLSETRPVDMIESIDNDGDATLRTQSGGRSAGGAGAASDLHAYLKLLNRRVKSFWIPPRGLNRLAIIQFRIKANGTLVSTTALPHEGEVDHEAESAAVAAITKAFPFQPLPKEVKAGYLDVRYTFNYRFNEIDEVKSGR